MRPILGKDLLAALVLLAGLALVGGCQCKPEIKARDLRITLDDSLAGTPVELNFYGANEGDKAAWATVPVDEYFKSTNPLREGTRDKGIVSFRPGGHAKSIEVKADGDPEWARLWNVWKQRGAWDLVVLAYIPTASARPGDPAGDPRRKVLPLDKCRWDDSDEPIEIQVHRDGISFTPAPKP